jgi:5-methylcytosine-specific restriction endonuclease McrA
MKEKTCSIFGHMCPVFAVSEPFSETYELRQSSRYIPRDVMIRVVRRDNSTCQICGLNLLDNEIEFDHTIPISRGGRSDETNLRVACEECNRKKSKNVDFEFG